MLADWRFLVGVYGVRRSYYLFLAFLAYAVASLLEPFRFAFEIFATTAIGNHSALLGANIIGFGNMNHHLKTKVPIAKKT